MAVAQAASPNMTIVVGNGSAAIPTGTYPDSYSYFAASDTSGGDSVTITTANTSNPRIDVIVSYVNKSATFSTSPANNPGAMVYAAVAGTPSATPAIPGSSAIQSAIGAANPYTILAQVAVPANVTQILNSNITDARSWASVSTANVTNPVNFSAYASVTTLLAASAWTVIAFGSKEFDTGSNYSTSTNEFTATVAGYHKFECGYQTASGATGEYYTIGIFKNGSASPWKNGPSQLAQGANDINLAWETPQMWSNAGDYVQVAGFQNSGGTKTVASGEALTYFAGYRVSRT
jgi:hypothetical protein